MQQINLYLDEFRPNREPLRSTHMVWGLVLLLLLLGATSIYQISVNRALNDQIASQRQVVAAAKLEVAELLKNSPKNDLAILDAQVLELTQEVARREQIYDVISNKNLGNNTGFSEFLRALGRQSLPSLSLQALSLQRGGNYVEFAGTARTADQVPLYIQRLRSEEAFKSVAFGVIKIDPVDAAKTVYRFSLAEMVAPQTPVEPHKTAVQMLLDLNQESGSKR